MRKVRIVEGKNVKFEIVEEDDETPERLAIQLAEAITAKAYYEQQSIVFKTQSNSERIKAQERSTLLFQLKEYQRNKKNNGIHHKVSRMEPMETYDADAIEQERKLYLKRANDFHKTSDKFLALAQEQTRRMIELQAKIEKARNGTA